MAGYLTVYCTQDYNVTLVYYLSHYLVDMVSEKAGHVLKLDKIDEGRNWLGADVLVFDSWHWQVMTDSTLNSHGARVCVSLLQLGLEQEGSQVMKDMDRMAAFTKALKTWAGWVDANLVRMCADLEDFQYPLFDEGVVHVLF
ncbi:protein trichome birefringence-like 41 [Hordeum vulgare]|nr:protein trichome birefringence-like 41 [Hordeum vulgare]